MRGGLAALAIALGAACGEGAAPAGTDPPEGEGQRADAAHELAALGYGAWDEDTDDAPRSGLVHLERARVMPWPRAWADDRNGVVVVDVDGTELRTLRVPDRTRVEFARFLAGGRIVCVSVDEGLTLLESSGDVVWHLDLACHHEVVVVPDGRPAGERRFAVAVHAETPWRGRRVRFDEVVFVDEATGELDERIAPWSTLEHREALLARAASPHPLDRASDRNSRETVYDYFHLNAIAFEGPRAMLVCLRNVDLLVEVDLDTRRLGPSFGPGELDWPHAPSPLEAAAGLSGERRILAFDNGKHRGWSRVVEIDFAAGEIVWQYGGRAGERLWSDVRGFAQRLPNGNTLITESERGRLIEVTAAGEVVWEFLNPETRGGSAEGARRSSRRRIYRAMALDPSLVGG